MVLLLENRKYRKNLDAYIRRFNQVCFYHMSIILLFNKVSYWVASEVCRIKEERVRGAIIEKFVEIAKVNLNKIVNIIVIPSPSSPSLSLTHLSSLTSIVKN